MLRSKELFVFDTNHFFVDDLLRFFSTNSSKESKTCLASKKGEQVGVGRLPEKKLNILACFTMVVGRI